MIEPEVLTSEVEGFSIQYLLYKNNENSNAKWLLLLHATGFFPWLWHPIARELYNFSIIVPYFCDHRVCDPERGLSWYTLAQDLNKLLDSLAIAETFMVGHSMGGTIVTLAHYLKKRARKMILIEPIFLPEIAYDTHISVKQHPLASKSIKRKNNWKDTEEAFSYLKSKSLFKNWHPEMLEIYITQGMKEDHNASLTLTCPPQREAALFMGSQALNPWPLLSEIDIPVMIVEGEISGNKKYIDLKRAASLFSHSRYMEIKEAGHMIPMEKPQEIISLIQDFL